MKINPYLLIITLIVAGCSASVEGDSESSKGNIEILSKVALLEVTEGPFSHAFPVQGNVETDKNASIMPEFPGSVEKVYATEGSRVSKGAKLIKINDDVLQSNREELLNQLSLANDLFERQERLWSKKIGKEIEFIQAKSAVESLNKAISTLDAQIEKTTIRAPFDGVLDRVFVKEGEFASPPMPCVRVIDLSNLYIRASVSDHYAGVLENGQSVRVEINGIDPIESSTRRVGRYINPANRTLEITVGLPRSMQLLPNMIATLWITDLAIESAISLPVSLVQQDSKGEDFVFIYNKNDKGGVVSKRLLTTGEISENRILITSGLRVGEFVVNRGGGRLIDGDLVMLIK